MNYRFINANLSSIYEAKQKLVNGADFFYDGNWITFMKYSSDDHFVIDGRQFDKVPWAEYGDWKERIHLMDYKPKKLVDAGFSCKEDAVKALIDGRVFYCRGTVYYYDGSWFEPFRAAGNGNERTET